jgi:phage repressor protein C with HTH and peptisase S24 domain
MEEKRFFIKIDNDGMAPEFLPGDSVLVDPNREPKAGNYVVAIAMQGNQVLLWQVAPGEKGDLRMKRFNGKKTVDAKRYKILGVVTQLQRDVPSPYPATH